MVKHVKVSLDPASLGKQNTKMQNPVMLTIQQQAYLFLSYFINWFTMVKTALS